MRCPRCQFDGEPVDGGCSRCGYGRVTVSSGALKMAGTAPSRLIGQSSQPLRTSRVNPGDVVRKGRFRILEQVKLPENQRSQGTAWLATDVQSSSRRVVLREVRFPEDFSGDKEQMVRSIALRQSELAQHSGLPKIIDMFDERGKYFIVYDYPEGETLGTLLKRQGGALPERMAAEFGRQLCEMLAYHIRRHPPFVHGSINPDTIVVSPDKKRVSLLFLPLFPPSDALLNKNSASAGYLAPEQVRSNTTEPSADIYGLAATLYHTVTGYDPQERLAFFHPPARRLNPTVTPGMEAILAQALRLSPTQRYIRPTEMLKDLSALVGSYPAASNEVPRSVANPLLLNSVQLRRQSRNRSLISTIIPMVVGLFLVLSFLLVYFRPFAGIGSGVNPLNATVTAQQQAALKTELALEKETFQKKGIGLSDGRFVLDPYDGRGTIEVSLKRQAAQAIAQGDLSSAVNFLNRTISADPTDAEAQIYNEDVHILQSSEPYVTIVLGIAIDSGAADYLLARAEMQGTYLAQHEINSGNLLPHFKLRILIDSSGVNNGDVATVAQFIANRVKNAGNLDHIIGVIGWPFSSQTSDALNIIAGVQLPLVSETASSVKLSGSSPYFFRVNPPDDLQGSTLGAVAVDPSYFHASKILVMRDPTDTYSGSLADAFTRRVESLHSLAINNSSDYFSEGNTTVANFQKAINDAIKNHADLIFMAGVDIDVVRLAHALGEAYRANPSLYLMNLKILAGDAVDTGLILGQGGGPDATIARNFPQDMQRLSFTAFGHPDEWTFLGLAQNQEPVFFHEWSSTYQSSTTTNNAPDPGNDAILAYDAMRVVVNAATIVHSTLTGQAVRDALATLGKHGIPPFQGVSGRILFDEQGNPIDKAVVVLEVKSSSNGNIVKLLKVAGMFR